MHIHGLPLASIPNQRSARLVLTLSVAIIAGKIWGTPLQDFKVFDQTLDAQLISNGSGILLIALVVNHLIHFFGDYVSEGRWNGTKKVNGLARVGSGAASIFEIEATLERINQEMSSFTTSAISALESRQDIERISGNLTNIAEGLADLKKRASTFSLYSIWYFYGWHLAVPIIAACIAYFMEWKPQ